MDEIAAGLQKSRVPYLWVVREESCRLSQLCGSEGLVVPWCDQLRVLCHSSIGGFLTHCGWGSTMESAFAGVPMITFPLNMDQVPNQKLIVEHWKNGLRLQKSFGSKVFVRSEEIAELVKKFMDMKNEDRIHMTKSAEEIKASCRRAIEKGGSSYENFDAFISDVLK
jgi:UDP:flavonoid glycosyltransferase YjiC (YdhE family)